MSRIDRIRRAALVRRAQKAEERIEEPQETAFSANLPVPAGPTTTFRQSYIP